MVLKKASKEAVWELQPRENKHAHCGPSGLLHCLLVSTPYFRRLSWSRRAATVSFTDGSRMMTAQPILIQLKAKLFQTGPCHFKLSRLSHLAAERATQERIGASSPDVPQGASRVTSEGYWKQEQLRGDTVVTPDSLLDTSVTTSKSQWSVIRLPPQSLLPSPPYPTQQPSPYHCKRRHVHGGQGPIPLGMSNYRKINTGMRCHLVSRPANNPPRECPCPPGALTSQTICSGLQDRASGWLFLCVLYSTTCGICFT